MSPSERDAVQILADEQGGIVTLQQVIDCGMTVEAVRWQVRSGNWQNVYPPGQAGNRPGVYSTFSGRLDRHAYLCAAVLVCGAGATLSHDTAAELHGIYEPKDAAHPIHVTVPSGRTVKPPGGVKIHYSSRIHDSRHPTLLPPRTRVEHTVVNLTQSASSLDAASSVVAQAVQHRLTTHARIAECMDTFKKLRWRAELQEICGRVGSGEHSLLEMRYARRVEKAHGLPMAERQVRRKADGRGYIVDNRYRKYRLRVELDGQRGHTGDGVFRDMWRDNAAVLDGDIQLRFGWNDVDAKSCESAAVVGTIMGITPKPCSPSCRAPALFEDLRRRAA